MGEDVQLIIISHIWKSLIYSQSRQVISMTWKDRWATHADQVEAQRFCINLFLEVLQHCSAIACVAMIFH